MKLKSRIIRPDYWQDKELAQISEGAQLMFIGLMGLADRFGLLDDMPEVITGQLRPFDFKNPTEKQLQELHDKKFIVRYEVEGKFYIWLPNLEKHQPIHKNEASYGIPLPDSVIGGFKVIPVGKGKFPTSKGKGNSKDNGKGKDKEIPFEEIVSHLNLLTNQDYNWETSFNKQWIRARWREGSRLRDFIYVNEVKAEEWLGTDKEKYLRPQTLYGTKMESYRQQRKISRQYSEKTNKALIAAAKYLEQEGAQIENTGQGQISSGDA